ncbi:hypothetical protein ASPWEDRAFT_99962 [Aspergillus wentii DTO 134E9]|uniref:DUF7703 domain-containing protein n=1 Tax=Aspergillus wentii DTO 134E9 TaxID=1073089 RepID=A0A1L9S2G2_ASPWE|nr:uncharacterized protein ASPWEDRAFT_99962 [Aspergillus wentii DTO 134E9]KAI9924385.1 hypothetical protein MW887_007011 [Aspergillus wentii]OJJ41339.1 hypothetical protein ASPWEDRAFT_99962 [Aspergillus wentii DTO 134E9]
MPGLNYRDDPPLGLVEGYEGNSVTVKVTMGALLSIALYNAVELTILLFLAFQHYGGTYFWSMLLSNVAGVMPTTIGALLHFFAIGPLWLALSMSTFGWYFMVPGQSVVLYSRLHLVLQSQKVLRAILRLIIISAVVLCVSTTVVSYGSAYIRRDRWNKAYGVMERLQVTWFCAQELLISSLYIYETVKLLKLSPEKNSRRTQILYELLVISLAIIMMDIALLVMEFLNFYYMQVILKSMVYSIKLKLEFAVLGRLVSITNINHHVFQGREVVDFPEFINPAYLATDFTHAAPTDSQSLRLRRTWETDIPC